MKRLLTSAFLLSFCFQGLHLLEAPTPIKPYMIFAPPIFLWCIIKLLTISKVNSTEILILIFLWYMLLSSTWAGNINLAILKASGILLLLVAYYTLRCCMGTLSSMELYKMISVGGIIVVAASLCYYAYGLFNFESSMLIDTHDDIDRGFYGLYLEGQLVRMRGLFDSPNNLSLICVFLFLFLDHVKFQLSIPGKLLVATSMILSLSATSWISLAAAYLFGLLFNRKFKNFFISIFALVILIFFIIYLIPDDILRSMIEVRFERISTGSGRDELFDFTLVKISEKPLVGYGLNQSRTLFENFRGFQSSHNSFLEAAIDGGIIGLAIFLICWISYLVFAFKLSKQTRTPFYFSSAFGFFIFSQSNVLTYVELSVLYLAVWFEMACRVNHPKLVRGNFPTHVSKLPAHTV